MPEDRYVRAVRRLWSTFQREGLDAMLDLVSGDVTWEPLSSHGKPIHGADALRRHFADMTQSGRSSTATAYAYEQHGTCVLVIGSLREVDVTGLRDSQPAWVYFFNSDDELHRAAGFRTRAEALAAIQTHCGDAAGV